MNKLTGLLVAGVVLCGTGTFWGIRLLCLLHEEVLIRDNEVAGLPGAPYEHHDFACPAGQAWKYYRQEPERWTLVGRSLTYFGYLARCEQQTILLLTGGACCVAAALYSIRRRRRP